jgi:nitrite reductase/ring-hydroxylating ferredoxin subunit
MPRSGRRKQGKTARRGDAAHAPPAAVSPRRRLVYNHPLGKPGERRMDEFVTVARVGDIPEGKGAAYPVRGRMVALFNCGGGEYRAIDDFCPHMGASLALGYLDDKKVVTCPWHAWRFRVDDGTWCDNPRIKTDSFEVRVAGEEIQVKVTERT